MNRYDILQTLEMIFPNSSDDANNNAWFVGKSNEGLLTIHFILDEGTTDDEEA